MDAPVTPLPLQPSPPATPPVLPYYAPPRQRKPRVWPTYVFALLIVLYPLVLGICVGIGIVILGMILHKSQDDMFAFLRDARLMLALMTLIMVINTALVFLFQLLSRRLRPHLPLFRRPRVGWVSIGLLTIGAVAVAELQSVALDFLQIPSPSLESIAKLLEDLRQMPPVIARIPLLPTLLIGFIGPIVEEAVFRGAIQSRLVRRHGPWWGILITSLFFGLYHWDIGQGLLAVVIGIYLGFVAYRTGSIWPAVFAHMAINTTSSILVFQEFDLQDPLVTVIFLATALLFAALGIFTLIRVPHYRRPPRSRLAPTEGAAAESSQP